MAGIVNYRRADHYFLRKFKILKISGISFGLYPLALIPPNSARFIFLF